MPNSAAVNVGDLLATLELDASKFLANIRVSQGELQKFGASLETTGRQVTEVDKFLAYYGDTTKKVDVETRKTGESLNTVARHAGTAATSLANLTGQGSALVDTLGLAAMSATRFGKELGLIGTVSLVALAGVGAFFAGQFLSDLATYGTTVESFLKKVQEEQQAERDFQSTRAAVMQSIIQNRIQTIDIIGQTTAARQRAAGNEVAAIDVERRAMLDKMEQQERLEEDAARKAVSSSDGRIKMTEAVAAVTKKFAAERVKVEEDASNKIREARDKEFEDFKKKETDRLTATVGIIDKIRTARNALFAGGTFPAFQVPDVAAAGGTLQQAMAQLRAAAAAPRQAGRGPGDVFAPGVPGAGAVAQFGAPGAGAFDRIPGQMEHLAEIEQIQQAWYAAAEASRAYAAATAIAEREAQRPRLVEGMEKVKGVVKDAVDQARRLATLEAEGNVSGDDLFTERARSAKFFADELEDLKTTYAGMPAVVRAADQALSSVRGDDFSRLIREQLPGVRREMELETIAARGLNEALRGEFPAAAAAATQALQRIADGSSNAETRIRALDAWVRQLATDLAGAEGTPIGGGGGGGSRFSSGRAQGISEAPSE